MSNYERREGLAPPITVQGGAGLPAYLGGTATSVHRPVTDTGIIARQEPTEPPAEIATEPSVGHLPTEDASLGRDPAVDDIGDAPTSLPAETAPIADYEPVHERLNALSTAPITEYEPIREPLSSTAPTTEYEDLREPVHETAPTTEYKTLPEPVHAPAPTTEYETLPEPVHATAPTTEYEPVPEPVHVQNTAPIADVVPPVEESPAVVDTGRPMADTSYPVGDTSTAVAEPAVAEENTAARLAHADAVASAPAPANGGATISPTSQAANGGVGTTATDLPTKERAPITDSEAGDIMEKPLVHHILTTDIYAAAEAKGYDHTAGRLVIDPEEAMREFGYEIASKLKLSKDGKKVLWPQPTDSPDDPQNFSDFRKNLMLVIITLAAFVPDFDSGIGIASLFPLAATYETTPTVINNLTSNWSIFLLGWGGLGAYVLGKKFGRLPVLFWSQVLGLGFLIGCAAAPNITIFTAMRCLTAVFSTAPQVTGLYVITDLFPFHLQSRKTSLWGFGYLVSPFMSPWLFSYFVARQTWRWAYGIGCIYSGIVVLLIVLFMEETLYDRHLDPVPPRPSTGIRYRIESLIGITGIKMAKYRPSFLRCCMGILEIIWRPNVLAMMFYVGLSFGFSIGINVTTAQFVGEPKVAGGYGLGEDIIATVYLTPIVGVTLGEVIGRYVNDYVADFLIKRNNGVFVAEMRLWALWIGMPLFVVGLVIYGYALQTVSYIALLVIGWGLFEIAVMITVIGILNYERDCYPHHSGEISALVNLSRTLGGFAIPYWQYPWAVANGALKEAGWESAIIAGMFLLVVPLLQWKGEFFRHKFGEKTVI